MKGCPGFQTQQTFLVLQHQGKGRLLKKNPGALCAALPQSLSLLSPNKM